MEALILLSPPWLQQMIAWFQSGKGRLIAAAMLWALFLVLKKAPKLGDWIESKLPTKMQKRTVVLLLAMLPAAIGGLASEVPLNELVITGLIAAFGSMGFNQAITEVFPIFGGRENLGVKIGEAIIAQAAAKMKRDAELEKSIEKQAKAVEESAVTPIAIPTAPSNDEPPKGAA